jgi:ribosome-associated toxin RatA of RatAB toxin-antitoxin module
MKHVKKSVLLWYSPAQMYRLVTSVQDYPQFLPWCERAEVLEQSAEGMTARLTLHYAGMRHAFTTRNRHDPDRSVRVELVDGPFSCLNGHWNFIALGEGPGLPEACKIEFDLCYAFRRGALEALISPIFDRIANTFVEAFVRRAEQVYGAS